MLGHVRDRLRGQLEMLCFPAFIRVPTIVHYREVFGAVVFVAEIGHCLMQSGFPALRGDLEIDRLEIEGAREQLSQFDHLLTKCKPIPLV